MKLTIFTNLRTKRSKSIIAAVAFLMLGLTMFLGKTENGRASDSTAAAVYLPIVHTNSRLAPVPKLVASIRLGESRCPSDMAFNSYSDLLYVTHEKTKNISVIRDKEFLGSIPTSSWPNYIGTDPLSNRVYIGNMMAGIAIIKGVEMTSLIPPVGEAYYAIVNPVNGFAYVTDLRGAITILRGDERVLDLKVPRFEGLPINWQLTADYDHVTGLTYFASFQRGVMTVVDGTEVVDQFSFEGKGASDMVVDAHRQLIFVANSHANEDEDSPNNISIIDLASMEVTSVYTAKLSKNVGLDPVKGYVYVSNPDNNSVTVLRGKDVVGTYWLGKGPRHVAVDSITGLAYVANSKETSVSVFRDGVPITTIDLPDEMGHKPSRVVIDEEAGRVYVLNNSSGPEPNQYGRQATDCQRPWVHILE